MCPLCQQTHGEPFSEDRKRSYLRCPTCALVFVPERYFLSAADEKAEYGHHQNSADDPGYRKFLSRLFNPLANRLSPHSHGLDFGSGPGPTLSVMFEEIGHTVAIYDPFFAPDTAPISRMYDFVTATEVIEHLHHPRQELDRLWGCIRPGGWLGIMTKRVHDAEAFGRWHYKNDPTHVCFFSAETFRWLADHLTGELTIIGDDVVLIRKPGETHVVASLVSKATGA